VENDGFIIARLILRIILALHEKLVANNSAEEDSIIEYVRENDIW
jgi:hypothetical protein